MAEATVHTHNIPRQETKTVWRRVPEEVVLTLTPQEAVTLHALTGKIAGRRDVTPRGHMETISRAFYDAGVPKVILGSGSINMMELDAAKIGNAINEWERSQNDA